MTTEKPIVANRTNAKRSTGPRSVVGKSSASRSNYRHGLSCPLRIDRATSEQVEAITRLLVDEGTSEQQSAAAAEFAEAQLELLRIRAVRREINGKIDHDHCDRHDLRRLAALDRYERLAHTRRRRASYKLDVQADDGREGS
jgi:hypothetical protein